MPPTGKQPAGHQRSTKEADDEEEPSHSLYVGNLSSDTVDSDLMALFAKYGALDSVTTYSSRNYAFVYFKNLDDAKAAKDALQGAVVRGNPIRIESARPGRPGKHLWIGGISSSVTKEQLEDEFSKFGKIEEYRFLRDRNSAHIIYDKIEDAVAALKSMNGNCLGGEQIRVDYLRSQPSRRDQSDHYDSKDEHLNDRKGMGPLEPSWMPPDSSSHYGHKRNLTLGGQRHGQLSKILWIGYPPSVQIDEQMLHNAMILFGEIERISSFPSRHYSFVEFRSTDEARRAKEGLQGRLFNDPRIQILFSNSDAPLKDNQSPFLGHRGPRPVFNEPPFGRVGLFGTGRPMGPGHFPGPLPPNSMHGPNMFARAFAQGFDPLHGSFEFFNDFNGSIHSFPDGNVNNPMAARWRKLSPPATGLLPSASGMRPPMRPLPGVGDGLDARDLKRSRIDGPSPIEDVPFHARRIDSHGIVDSFGLHQPDRGASGQRHYSPIGVKSSALGLTSHSEHYGTPDRDHCWRGIIAKGGTPVCHARCVPVGKGIDSPLPEIVNCSSRTGLDMLTKHYAEATGFDIVFFLPDSEDDFASYTEFLRYLGLKNRAGVAKLDDGTTLFLVPPSEFLTKVLNVSGPERLYGVVLKMPQMTSVAIQHLKQSIPPQTSHHTDIKQLPSSQTGYSLFSQNEYQTLKMLYNRGLHEDSLPHTGHVEEPHLPQSVSLNYVSNPAAPPPVEVSLTPELIATLVSLIPTSIPSAAGSVVPSSSSIRPPFPASLIPDKAMQSQGWIQDNQAPFSSTPHQEQASHPSQQFGHQFSNQTTQLSQLQTYMNIPNGPDYSGQPILGGAQVQGHSLSVQQPVAISARPLDTYSIPSQGGQFLAPQSDQHYQLGANFSSTTSAQVLSGNMPQHQIVTQVANDKGNMDFSTQVQQLQNSLSGSSQRTSEGDTDKNQRYQSTLQFAASLLLQIQQQQQQASAQAAQGSGNQQ